VRISVLVRRLWAGLVLDGLATVAPSNADHRLPLVAQPLGLSALGVALIIFGGPPAIHDLMRLQVGVDVDVHAGGSGNNPASFLRLAALRTTKKRAASRRRESVSRASPPRTSPCAAGDSPPIEPTVIS